MEKLDLRDKVRDMTNKLGNHMLTSRSEFVDTRQDLVC